MGCIKTVLTPGARHDAVVGAIIFAMLIAKFKQLLFSAIPINAMVFSLGEITSITNTMFIEMDRGFLALLGVLILNCGIWALVGYHAFFAISDRCGQSIECIWIWVVFCKGCQIDCLRIFYLVHFLSHL